MSLQRFSLRSEYRVWWKGGREKTQTPAEAVVFSLCLLHSVQARQKLTNTAWRKRVIIPRRIVSIAIDTSDRKLLFTHGISAVGNGEKEKTGQKVTQLEAATPCFDAAPRPQVFLFLSFDEMYYSGNRIRTDTRAAQ